MMAVVLVMSACGSANTPKDVAMESVACIQDGDFEKYVDMLYVKPDGEEQAKADRDGMVSMLKSKASETIGKKDGIKSFDYESEEVAEDGNTAKVNIKIVYGNGEEDNETVKLRKNEAGEWKVDLGK